jgi:nitrate reductase alpha subunit
MNPPVPSGVDGKASDALLKLGKFFSRWEESDDGRVVFRKGGRAGDVFYRDRWSHDKVVRSTHGVNCTGSCSWKIYVRDGIITWEAQQTDYPSVGPDRPEYEPRGCPRGAAFSWYTYSPTRVRYPYARGVLLEMYREAKQRLGDPAQAGTDAALAMAMGHVILKEFFVDRQVPFFADYVKTYTDLPFLVTLTENAEHGGLVPGKFLTEGDLEPTADSQPEAAWKPCCWMPLAANRWFPTVRWASVMPNQALVAGTLISKASPQLCRYATSTTTRSSRCCSPASRRLMDRGRCSAAASRLSASVITS